MAKVEFKGIDEVVTSLTELSELPDEVIDAMAEVGNAMSKDLRETGIGGLAGTPTGRAICEIVTMDNGEEED